jgi:hypothetical protein
MLNHQKILIGSRINIRIEIIVAKELILVVKSSDKSGAVNGCVVHVFSVAGEEAVWERKWTVCQVAARVLLFASLTDICSMAQLEAVCKR